MLSVSPTKERILRHLAEYKYLCVSHLLTLGATSSVQVCRRELRELNGRFGFTGKMTSVSIPESMEKRIKGKKVRNEDMHYLTKKGADFLDEVTDMEIMNTRFPKRTKTSLANDYFHRFSSVSVHIAYNKWIEKQNFKHSDTLLYYDKRQKFKKIKTTIESRVKLKNGKTKTPDLVMGYKNQIGEGRVFVFEVYNGARPQYILDETKEMILTLQENMELSERVGIKKLPRILITCETQKRMEKAMQRIKEDSFFNFKKIDALLWFNIDTRVWSNFGNGWINLSGEIVDLERL